jgi:photosystem II stability/assembly factor-like uncharacterized protein
MVGRDADVQGIPGIVLKTTDGGIHWTLQATMAW